MKKLFLIVFVCFAFYSMYKIGDKYIEKGVSVTRTVKSFKVLSGSKCPTKAYYDDGTTVQNSDNVQRIVLSDGQIRYVKL